MAKQGESLLSRVKTEVNEGTGISLEEGKCWETYYSVSLQGRNEEVKKPAEFMLQRVEKESWQQDESGGESEGKNITE